jgi:hypothetical protein
MDLRTVITIAGLAITMAAGFWKVASTLGRMELKLDLLWDAYLKGQVPFVARRASAHERRRPSTGIANDPP